MNQRVSVELFCKPFCRFCNLHILHESPFQFLSPLGCSKPIHHHHKVNLGQHYLYVLVYQVQHQNNFSCQAQHRGHQIV
uniref:Putative ovule protein n=1 Tax=Solanum chacoense TaxID=4108 RepID=A0A0V0GV43_SOLCH